MNEEFEIGSVRLAARAAHILFTTFGWKWNSGDEAHVPSTDEIEDAYEYLAKIASGYGRASTGRLTVEVTDLGLEYSVELYTDHGFGVDDE